MIRPAYNNISSGHNFRQSKSKLYTTNSFQFTGFMRVPRKGGRIHGLHKFMKISPISSEKSFSPPPPSPPPGCPAGQYMTQDFQCTPCPNNTNTTFVNGIACPCLPRFFRAASDDPGRLCTRKWLDLVLCIHNHADTAVNLLGGLKSQYFPGDYPKLPSVCGSYATWSPVPPLPRSASGPYQSKKLPLILHYMYRCMQTHTQTNAHTQWHA